MEKLIYTVYATSELKRSIISFYETQNYNKRIESPHYSGVPNDHNNSFDIIF